MIKKNTNKNNIKVTKLKSKVAKLKPKVKPKVKPKIKDVKDIIEPKVVKPKKPKLPKAKIKAKAKERAAKKAKKFLDIDEEELIVPVKQKKVKPKIIPVKIGNNVKFWFAGDLKEGIVESKTERGYICKSLTGWSAGSSYPVLPENIAEKI